MRAPGNARQRLVIVHLADPAGISMLARRASRRWPRHAALSLPARWLVVAHNCGAGCRPLHCKPRATRLGPPDPGAEAASGPTHDAGPSGFGGVLHPSSEAVPACARARARWAVERARARTFGRAGGAYFTARSVTGQVGPYPVILPTWRGSYHCGTWSSTSCAWPGVTSVAEECELARRMRGGIPTGSRR